MGTIYLVRHGQAAYGTDDYDRLTETGFAQSQLLADYFRLRDIRFDAVYTGELRRHAETARAVLENYVHAGDALRAEQHSALNEYSAESLVHAFTGALPVPNAAAVSREPGVVRQQFGVLKQALLAWTEGLIQPVGMPDWKTFQDGAVAALVDARQRFAAGNVLVISSGGPISAIVAAALDAPAQTAVELNLRMRNTSVTEFACSARRHSLISFNALPHLEAQPDGGLATYA